MMIQGAFLLVTILASFWAGWVARGEDNAIVQRYRDALEDGGPEVPIWVKYP